MLWRKAKDIETFPEAAISVHVDVAAYYLEKHEGSEGSNVNSLAASFFSDPILSLCNIFGKSFDSIRDIFEVSDMPPHNWWSLEMAYIQN